MDVRGAVELVDRRSRADAREAIAEWGRQTGKTVVIPDDEFFDQLGYPPEHRVKDS